MDKIRLSFEQKLFMEKNGFDAPGSIRTGSNGLLLFEMKLTPEQYVLYKDIKKKARDRAVSVLKNADADDRGYRAAAEEFCLIADMPD